MDKKIIKISVRELVEYTLRSGDITTTFLSSARAVDGIRAHQKFQKEAGETYQEEVSISMEVNSDDFLVILQGRIDGVDESGDLVLIDEIKSTGGSVDDITRINELHLAQAKMYGYMYGTLNKLEAMLIRLTYIELEDFKIKQFVNEYKIEELAVFFQEVITSYLRWLKKRQDWSAICKESINQLEFPFEGFRKGQRKLMSSVYKTIVDNNRLFARAPTGIGKTIATLFPSIKALAMDKTSKIFYLTAKTIGKTVALDTLQLLEDKGLRLKRIIITAKDKTCLNDTKSCNEKDCPYAKGHYDRVNFVIEEMFEKYDCFDRYIIESYSEKHQVCPYELSLDLALFCDVIICDYNYAFDPVAALKRFFVEGDKDYTLLIDEAHNLVQRAREMYSAVLEKDQVLAMKKKVETLDKRLFKYFNQLNKILIDYRKICNELPKGYQVKKDYPFEIEDTLRGIIYRTEKIFKLHKDWQYMDELLDFYFVAYDFVKKAESYDENYITYYDKVNQNLLIKLYCIDPSKNLFEATEKLKGVVYFSATLLPLNYYVDILGGNSSSYGLELESSFDSDNLCLLIENNISTKYADRPSSINKIVDIIDKVVETKKGNYIVFFPSYKYMEEVYTSFTENIKNDDLVVEIQKRGLNEGEKEAFINQFSQERKVSLLVFAVLGGMFSEGIDLKGDQLSCAMIVGVGLPQVCLERDLIKEFFDQRNLNGFDYSYVYPGMNKVLQGAGRVIRTASDRGAVILIDTRFNNRQYKRLFPKEWYHYKLVTRENHIDNRLEEFWR